MWYVYCVCLLHDYTCLHGALMSPLCVLLSHAKVAYCHTNLKGRLSCVVLILCSSEHPFEALLNTRPVFDDPTLAKRIEIYLISG